MWRISRDPFFNSFQFGLEITATTSLDDTNPGEYHACVCDNEWYIGNVVEVSHVGQDIYFKFMNKSNSSNFSWQSKNDYC